MSERVWRFYFDSLLAIMAIVPIGTRAMCIMEYSSENAL